MTAKKKLPKVKVYEALETAVERGLRFGWSRAYKHQDCPEDEEVFEHQMREIMLALSEDFEL